MASLWVFHSSPFPKVDVLSERAPDFCGLKAHSVSRLLHMTTLPRSYPSVIPAQAVIQDMPLDSRFRGSDEPF